LRKFKSCLVGSIFLWSALLASTASVGQAVPQEVIGGLKWRLIGPFRGGRVVAVAGIAGDPSTFYFGSVNGGVWKTTDAGTVWTPIFDREPVGSIGAIAIANSDTKTIYVGTGESDIRSDLSSGNGVYKSTDGGATWNHIGLEVTRQISRIVIDPRDPATVYVGALGHAYGPNEERGVYKSVDSGAHWTKTLDLGAEIGISDLAMATAAPALLFAGSWHTHRPPWSTYAPIDEPGSGLYRSQNSGKTWTRLQQNGLPDGDWGRVGVEVAPDGRRVYALISVKGHADKSGLYRSDDGGDHWALANSDPRITSRAWYFNRITVDPQNSDVIYMPNVALYRSEDGGKTISVVRGAPGGDDYHQLWIDPKNSASMVLGTDQGTTISLNRGQTWSTWYNQPTAQLYHVTTDNQFPYAVLGAQQDSGSAGVASRTDHDRITPRDWFTAGPSESGYLVVDQKDPNIIYLSGTFGPIARFNRKTGLSQDISPWPAIAFDAEINRRKYRAPWTPVLAASAAEREALYLGTQYVMKTVDGGLHWQTISPDLTGSSGSSAKAPDRSTTRDPRAEDNAARKTQSSPEQVPTRENAKQNGYGVVFSIAPSPLNRDLIWAGSDTGLIHLTRDGGKSWKNVTPSGLSDWSKISVIEASRFDPAVAYAAIDRSRLEDQAPYIYRTRDYGATWQRVNEGIGARAFLRAIREDSQRKGLLFAGTELGVFVSFNDGEHWQPLQFNLPITSVRDLNVHGDDLVIATHGRSFWILDDITPLRQATEAIGSKGPWLYHPATSVRIDNDIFSGTPLPPEEPTADNPPNGALIDYFLPTDAGAVQIEIFDAQQNLVRRFNSNDHSYDKISTRTKSVAIADRWLPPPPSVEKSAGMHRFLWDLGWKASIAAIDDEDEGRAPDGPKVVPGTYQVRLTVDGQVQNQSLKVVMDPRSAATEEVLAEQFKIGRQILGDTTEARRALAEMTSVQKQLVNLQEKLGSDGTNKNADSKSGRASNSQDGDVKAALEEAQSSTAKIISGKRENATPGLQEAYNAMASALRVVESGDRAIPSQALAVYKEASEQAKTRIGEWNSFKQSSLARLNEKLRTAKLEPVSPRQKSE
jgi:photosystem II stability/assembly factor-like uncharacterized protein